MIVGGIRLADPAATYDQSNDMLEGLLVKLGYAHPLQSCGPNAAGSCMEAAGYNLSTPTVAGYSIPADDLMTEWFNNPRNYAAIRGAGIDPWAEPNNRHARLYPLAVRALWGIHASWLGGFALPQAVPHLRRHRTLQVCLTDPGHYIALVGYDEATGEYVFNDSWRARPRVPALPANGFNARMTKREEGLIAGEAVLYYPQGDKGD